MQSIIESVVLGLIQGLTEFLPISSSGHLIVARELFGFSMDGSLAFDVFLNTATLLAVVYCFWGDLKRIFIDLFTEGLSHRSKNLILCVIIGTLPAALLGLKYGDKIEMVFRNSASIIIALIVGSFLMFLADKSNKKAGEGESGEVHETGGIKPLKSFFIGVFQALALIPGVSRSGSTISGGILSKLSREEAIRFSFLLYIPVSLGAALKTFFDVALNGSGSGLHGFLTLPSIIGFLAALFSGVWAVKFMVRYLSRNSFTPFIIYRLVVACLLALFFLK